MRKERKLGLNYKHNIQHTYEIINLKKKKIRRKMKIEIRSNPKQIELNWLIDDLCVFYVYV